MTKPAHQQYQAGQVVGLYRIMDYLGRRPFGAAQMNTHVYRVQCVRCDIEREMVQHALSLHDKGGKVSRRGCAYCRDHPGAQKEDNRETDPSTKKRGRSPKDDFKPTPQGAINALLALWKPPRL